jgi:hypothetical protein
MERNAWCLEWLRRGERLGIIVFFVFAKGLCFSSSLLAKIGSLESYDSKLKPFDLTEGKVNGYG